MRVRSGEVTTLSPHELTEGYLQGFGVCPGPFMATEHMFLCVKPHAFTRVRVNDHPSSLTSALDETPYRSPSSLGKEWLQRHRMLIWWRFSTVFDNCVT